MAMEQRTSDTLTNIDASRRPPEEVACVTCPNSMWYASQKALQCYCRIMFVVSWDSANNVKTPAILACDGEAM